MFILLPVSYVRAECIPWTCVFGVLCDREMEEVTMSSGLVHSELCISMEQVEAKVHQETDCWYANGDEVALRQVPTFGVHERFSSLVIELVDLFLPLSWHQHHLLS